MVVDVGTHLDLLDLLRPLALARGIRLFLGFVLVLADVQEFRDGRIGVGRYLDQVQSYSGGLLHGFLRKHHAQIFAILVNYADLGRGNEFIVTRTIFGRRRQRAPGSRMGSSVRSLPMFVRIASR